jgi:hypothetical protein
LLSKPRHKKTRGPGSKRRRHTARLLDGRSRQLVVHENSQQKNNRQWNADQPKQCAFSKSHVSLL